MNKKPTTIDDLEKACIKAPDGMADRIMARLPEAPDSTFMDKLTSLWPSEGKWLTPAFVGVAATLLLALGLFGTVANGMNRRVTVTFQLQAPDAEKIELLGSFNAWEPGTIVLDGPDKSGRWCTTLTLPEGRYEYMFLVNGETWVTDPSAAMHRSDGFGSKNAVIQIQRGNG
jgi:hypothetical protein